LFWDVLLQRLFSTFPNSWPGFGLLLLRSCVGVALICFGIAGLWNSPHTSTFVQGLISAAGGFFLLGGLWTPVMGALVALNEVWIAFALHSPPHANTWIQVFLAILALSIAMLGPGAWSIDARLFGRKRIDIDHTRGRKPSL
jgi:putative oxidoreductase